RGGLYQLMRSRVLGDALVQRGQARCADVAVCIHRGNTALRQLPKKIGGSKDVVEAFNALVPSAPVQIIDPADILAAVRAEDSGWRSWGAYMVERYGLRSSS